jgi:hypothetical protein
MTPDMDLVVIFGGIVLIVLIASFFGYLNRQSKQKLIEKLIDKGQSLSPEILASIGNGKHRTNSVGHAVYLMLLGIALAIFFWAMTGYGGFGPFGHAPSFLPAIGLFPFIIGLSQLIGLAFEKRKDR